MKNVLRSVNTHFWNDRYVRKLNKDEKLLYLYFLTSPLTNLLGIYELTIERMSFDTKITENTIDKCIEKFVNDGKILYANDYIFMLNFLKNQNLNENMKKNVLKIANNLPDDVTDLFFNDITKPFKAFQSLCKAFGKGKGKGKGKNEREGDVFTIDDNGILILIKVVEEVIIPKKKIDFEEFWKLYDKVAGNKSKLTKKWDSLSLKTQTLIIEYLPKYKESTPDKQFRKHPSTFLNNESWLDEIIERKEIIAPEQIF